jgi:hypothetical protein
MRALLRDHPPQKKPAPPLPSNPSIAMLPMNESISNDS